MTPEGPCVSGLGAEGFRALYDAHYGFVGRALRHFGVPVFAVDDALQDVFIIVFRRQASFEGRSSLRTWLWGIARKVASTQARTRFRADRRINALTQEALVGPAEEHLINKESSEQGAAFVQSFLADLPEKQRDVFFLSEVEGLGQNEVSEMLNLPVGTVYSRLSRARDRFEESAARWRRMKEGRA